MKLALTIQILLILVSLVSIKCSYIQLKLNDFCRATDLVCTGHYNKFYKYTQSCRKIRCSGEYSYECGTEFCAKEKSNCDDILQFNLIMNTIDLNHKFKNSFLNQIQKCSIDLLKPTFEKKNEICSNIGYCYTNDYSAAKKIACPCIGKLNYVCGGKFCTKNSLVCDYVLNNPLASNSTYTKCENDKVRVPNNQLFMRILSKIFRK